MAMFTRRCCSHGGAHTAMSTSRSPAVVVVVVDVHKAMSSSRSPVSSRRCRGKRTEGKLRGGRDERGGPFYIREDSPLADAMAPFVI
ncbi:hypothetical protein BC832DRAFT_566028 [Gaertneriomyces semiglobifer]|nr:hypothetical protein BC832DRAFT_566028 [Gaertneriomyces semiglobifer]